MSVDLVGCEVVDQREHMGVAFPDVVVERPVRELVDDPEADDAE